jgi:hypothetical protein
MPVDDVIPIPAYGVFHRGIRRSLLRVATVDPISRPMTAWPGALAILRASGATTVRVLIPWKRHAHGPGLVCLDGSDGRTPDALGVLRLAVDVGLDVWVDAGPISGGVPTWVAETCPGARAVDALGRVTGSWSTSDSGFRAAAVAWATGVALASMTATGGQVAIWETDGRLEHYGVPADHSPATVARFRRWLQDRYEDDRALAREWLRPELRVDVASPPEILGSHRAQHVRWVEDAIETGRRIAHWARRRLVRAERLIPRRLRPGTPTDRAGMGRDMSTARHGHSPGQLADWYAFSVDAWHEYLGEMRLAVEPTMPDVTYVAGEVGRAGTPGIGYAGAAGREQAECVALPVVRLGSSGHDAAWAAASLTARAGLNRPVMVSLQISDQVTSPASTALSALAEGAVVVELPEAAFGDADVRRLAEWLGHVEEPLTASTRLDDRVAWIDDPAHAGADADDLHPVTTRVRFNRGQAADAFASVREAGLAPVVVDPSTFVADEVNDLGALLAPTRRWIDLERYGSLVVHVLRGGNLVAFPHAPSSQRDGTAFRSTFLWPTTIATGGRVQVHDGTSTLVPEVVSAGGLGVRSDWIDAIVEDVSPRFRVAPEMRLAVTARLLPDGSCLAFVINLTRRHQIGAVGVPDPAALGLGADFTVSVEFATSGAAVRPHRLGIHVDIPAGGAVVARLSSDG